MFEEIVDKLPDVIIALIILPLFKETIKIVFKDLLPGFWRAVEFFPKLIWGANFKTFKKKEKQLTKYTVYIWSWGKYIKYGLYHPSQKEQDREKKYKSNNF